MKRRPVIISLLCYALAASGVRPLPLVQAQETPRTDPTASAHDSAMLPPPSIQHASTQPSTRPAEATLAERYPTIRGTEGFWRVAKDHSGVWWFISPKGEPEFLNTVTTVQPSIAGRQANGADCISRDFNGDEKQLDRWAEATLARVREVGFKGLGAWSHPILHKHDIPMTRDLNVWTWLRERSTRIYSPEWAAMVEESVKTQVVPLRENRNLVGYYSDNELDWGDASVGPAAYFDGLSNNDANRAMVVKVIRQTWPTIESFNADWKSSLKDWSDLETWKSLPREPSAAYQKL